MDRNRAIGRSGDMPWHLPADLAHFKRTTLGHPVIMGRKTFESIGRPLPGRRNIVITRQTGWSADGIDVAGSLEAALAEVGDIPCFVIGGGEIYRLALPLAHELHVTIIDTAVADADTWFPAFDDTDWRLASEEHRDRDDRNAFDLSFRHYVRRGA